MPVALDPIGIVGSDGVNQFQVLRELQRDLILAAFHENGFSNLVAPLSPQLEKSQIDEASFVAEELSSQGETGGLSAIGLERAAMSS